MPNYLSFYLNVTTKPFGIQVFDLNKNVIVEMNRFAFHDYLNIFSMKHTTLTGDGFHGLMGLGERVLENSLWYETGVYSMWNRGDTPKVDTGRPAGGNLYGTHPFYMYRANLPTWVGVYQNVPHA